MSDPLPATLMLGQRELTAPSAVDARMSVLLWGMAGCGKTTLAATAPGEKLWILFDPDGANALIGRDDIHILDLSGEKHAITERFKADDPFGIEKLLKDRPQIMTVVFDSVTTFSILATENAVAAIKSATIENPGMKGYGHRSALVLRACVSLLRLTKRMNKHMILIAHEDTPTTNEAGDVMFITTSLSSKMSNNIGIQLSEIWWMNDTGKERRIAVRPVRSHTPMKTRMWDARAGEFVWKYDAIKWEGDGIAQWFNAWQQGGGHKLPLPS